MISRIEVISYFVWSPFSLRDYHRFGVDEFRKRFEVFVFDCSSWLAPPEVVELDIEIACFPGYRKISSLQELNREIVGLGIDKRCAAFDSLGFCRGSFEVRQRIIRAGCTLIAVDLGRLPAPTRSLWEWCSYLWLERHRLPRAIMARLRRMRISPPEIAIVGGRLAENAARANKVHLVIRAHSMDYETYLNQPNVLAEGTMHWPSRHITYLDEDFVFHQDYIHLGLPCLTSPENFFPAMNRVFAYLEDQFNLPVVIAAHPRSSYEQRGDLFAGRKIIKGQTLELVRDSELVIAHSSTSISFAVLFGKPIVLLTSDDINKDIRQFHQVRSFAKQLGRPILNVNRFEPSEFARERLLSVNSNFYEAYRDNYIKTRDSADIPLWPLVGRELASYSRNQS